MQDTRITKNQVNVTIPKESNKASFISPELITDTKKMEIYELSDSKKFIEL